MQSGDDSSSDSASESDLDDTRCVTPINEVTEPWKDISVRCLLSLHEKDIDKYFIYQKSYILKKTRHMKKKLRSVLQRVIFTIFFTMQSPRTLTAVT